MDSFGWGWIWGGKLPWHSGGWKGGRIPFWGQLCSNICYLNMANWLTEKSAPLQSSLNKNQTNIPVLFWRWNRERRDISWIVNLICNVSTAIELALLFRATSVFRGWCSSLWCEDDDGSWARVVISSHKGPNLSNVLATVKLPLNHY